MRKLFVLIVILALASLACGISVPKAPQPGPEVTEPIHVDYPDSGEVNLMLTFGAGELILNPGADALVDGTAVYNYAEVKPQIVSDGGDVEVKMGNLKFPSLPTLTDLKNVWDLKLGGQPMNLSIQSGAYDGTFEFGGLALTNLSIEDGASHVELAFSEPNQAEMNTFRYTTGASDVKLTGLANANFNLFDFSAGAGDYTLDFSGGLKRDASIKVETGLSNVIIIVPDGVNAMVTVEGGLSNVNAGSGWDRSGEGYRQEGEGPMLTFVVEMGAGNLTLTH
ncbi:MAG TPA: toast rack family protein [Anaerolineales bacterium]|nr:toast rack family protein [Anaerolineales bacterium]HNN13256.1 toast rack family protein [Anaerolineales bacterium]HNO93893.1 toast rack family protein [Anaerolineales bacterium]